MSKGFCSISHFLIFCRSGALDEASAVTQLTRNMRPSAAHMQLTSGHINLAEEAVLQAMDIGVMPS